MRGFFIIFPLLLCLLLSCPSPDKNDNGLPSDATPSPTFKDDPAPTADATPDVTDEPTAEPSGEITAAPTTEPTGIPTAAPTIVPTEIPTPVPSPILIANFDSYTLEQAPGESWISGCVTSFVPVPPEAANRGVIVNNKINDRVYLTLMNDIFGRRGTFGAGTSGYSYAQIEFSAPAKGTISFDFYHAGWNFYPPSNATSFTLDFFRDLQITDLDNESVTADWSGNTLTPDFLTAGVALPDSGTYRLTWRVIKKADSANLMEDEIYIDNISFTYN
jgi:hypothetical protein